jgi:hypothetical protein
MALITEITMPDRKVQDIGVPVPTEEALPPELEAAPVLEELTGRASKTEDDLEALFENEDQEHLIDGFKGGSGDDEPNV